MFGRLRAALLGPRARSAVGKAAAAAAAAAAAPAPIPIFSAPAAASREAEAPPEGFVGPEGPEGIDMSVFEKERRADAYKKHFADSYDAVAGAVRLRERAEEDMAEDKKEDGAEAAEARTRRRLRVAVAKVLMERLGYSPEDLETIGEDADRMQGTGNPFPLAALQPGEVVLDLGSGFGVDAILAGSKVGARGRVVGVDLSLREVKDANRRVLDRGMSNVRFYQMDIERLSAIPDAVRFARRCVGCRVFLGFVGCCC
jgi:SAM-dependent methyltransferase